MAQSRKRVKRAAKSAARILTTKRTKFETPRTLRKISTQTLKEVEPISKAVVKSLKHSPLRNIRTIGGALRSRALAKEVLRKRSKKKTQ